MPAKTALSDRSPVATERSGTARSGPGALFGHGPAIFIVMVGHSARSTEDARRNGGTQAPFEAPRAGSRKHPSAHLLPPCRRAVHRRPRKRCMSASCCRSSPDAEALPCLRCWPLLSLADQDVDIHRHSPPPEVGGCLAAAPWALHRHIPASTRAPEPRSTDCHGLPGHQYFNAAYGPHLLLIRSGRNGTSPASRDRSCPHSPQ